MSARKLPGNVYAIVRAYESMDDSVPMEIRVKVTSVVPDEATAKSEVERLMALNSHQGYRYFSQATRLADSASTAFESSDDT